jgi:hypothetical protein
MARPSGTLKVKKFVLSWSRHRIIGERESDMEAGTSDPKQYVKQLLELYRRTPGTLGRVRREDRRLAVELYSRRVSLQTIEAAFLLATARRSLRAPDAAPLAPVRSLAYFVPVIEEVMTTPLPGEYRDYLKHKLRNIQAAHDSKITDGCRGSPI